MSLKYTADQTRDRSSARIGKGAHPNAWWAWIPGSDCMAGMSSLLGIRTNPRSTEPSEISIAAFRAHYGWDEVPIGEARAGMLVAEYWKQKDSDPETSDIPNHIEMIHTIDHAAGTITTDSANTGPRPGQATPVNYYRKTRTITANNFKFAIVVPYRGDPDSSPYGAKAPTALPNKNVKLVAAFLNDRAKDLGHPETTSVKDGVTGPRYWTLVQAWGRKNGIYGSNYLIDGIVGPRTRNVEAVILKRAQAATKK